jgi:hypothetical protein
VWGPPFCSFCSCPSLRSPSVVADYLDGGARACPGVACSLSRDGAGPDPYSGTLRSSIVIANVIVTIGVTGRRDDSSRGDRIAYRRETYSRPVGRLPCDYSLRNPMRSGSRDAVGHHGRSCTTRAVALRLLTALPSESGREQRTGHGRNREGNRLGRGDDPTVGASGLDPRDESADGARLALRPRPGACAVGIFGAAGAFCSP